MPATEVFLAARVINQRGRLYPVPDDQTLRTALDDLVLAGLVLAVPATAHSLRGYAAVGYVGVAGESNACRS